MRTMLAAALAFLAACTPATGGGAIALEGTSWTLVEIGGRPPIAGADVTLRFTGDRAEGFAGCNQYGAPFTTSSTALSFGPAISTKRACVEEPRNAQETAYLGALEKVASYSASSGRLTLSDAAGSPLLIFTRARE